MQSVKWEAAASCPKGCPKSTPRRGAHVSLLIAAHQKLAKTRKLEEEESP